MNGRREQTWETNSEGETFELARKMGAKALPGQVFTLMGDLGAGKTVFSKGFASGIGVQEPVNSPTFTIVQVYDSGRLPLYHFDVYRISDITEMDEIGYEEYFFGQGVSLVEWGNLIEEILPEQYTAVTIAKDVAKGFDYRVIKVQTCNRESREDTSDADIGNR